MFSAKAKSKWENVKKKNISAPVTTDATVMSGIRPRSRTHTFEEVGSEPGFVDWAIGHKLHPQLVGAALDVIWLVVAAEAAQQRAVFRVPITNLEIVISTAVVPLNLQNKGKKESIKVSNFLLFTDNYGRNDFLRVSCRATFHIMLSFESS